MDSHRLTNQPADSSRRRIGYSVPDARPQKRCTSAPESCSVGFSRNASSTRSVCKDMRTLRSSLPIVGRLHRVGCERNTSIDLRKLLSSIAGTFVAQRVRAMHHGLRAQWVRVRPQHPDWTTLRFGWRAHFLLNKLFKSRPFFLSASSPFCFSSPLAASVRSGLTDGSV